MKNSPKGLLMNCFWSIQFQKRTYKKNSSHMAGWRVFLEKIEKIYYVMGFLLKEKWKSLESLNSENEFSFSLHWLQQSLMKIRRCTRLTRRGHDSIYLCWTFVFITFEVLSTQLFVAQFCSKFILIAKKCLVNSNKKPGLGTFEELRN
jgi:hypothetical protein